MLLLQKQLHIPMSLPLHGNNANNSPNIIPQTCAPAATITGTITVFPIESITPAVPANSTQTTCYGVDITPIVLTIVGEQYFRFNCYSSWAAFWDAI